VALAILKDPMSDLAESYRALRTSVLFSTAPRPPQTLLVTSTQPGEGKTCTSLNLALALSQRGGRVLVVDSDLRKPGIAKALGMDGLNAEGLSGVLTGAYSLDDVLKEVGIAPGLWVLPAGPNPPNPAELLSSPSMEKLMAELRERFDHVVLDSPPALVVTDATVLSSLVDGVIVVVESGVTPRGALVRTHKTIRIAGGRLLGVVLNKVNFRQNGYYDAAYDYGHAYYHGQRPSAAAASQGVSLREVHR
jgi:capsular exopolysaccharide synthesis family protein